MSWQTVNVLQWFRYLVERWLIVPAATWLPLRAALSCADAAAAIDLIVPTRMSRTVFAEIHAATGRTGWSAVVLGWRRLARPRYELVYLTRMSHGRERLDDWRVIEENGEHAHALAAGGQPFIMVTGHFSSAAINVAQQTFPRPISFVAGDAPSRAIEPAELRRQLGDRCRDDGRQGLLGSRYSADELWIRVPDVWGPAAEWNAATERVAAGKGLLTVLRRQRGLALIRIDAIWQAASGLARPFAGVRERRFALGAARVARLAQCPLIPFVAILGSEPRTVIVEWGDPIGPPARADDEADGLMLDRALSYIEAAIGRHPTHYLAYIGWERCWQPRTQSWEPRRPAG